MNKTQRHLVVLLSVACLVVLAGCTKKTGAAGKTEYVYATVSRGSMEKTVSSSGTLDPVSSVDVLAQMSGIAEKVYADYNDHVTKGQTLVVLNTDMLKLQQEEERAAVTKARANYELQQLNYQNQLKLAEKGLISEYDVKSGKTSLEVYKAELVSAEASLRAIETEISQYAFIQSPITGVVLERNVDVGQNVVEGTSSNSTSVFTIAEDLTQMRIEATVDEIDIASIHKDQDVRFTVEALPGKEFTGKVQMIHLVPETTDNVVSYSVMVTIANSDGSLLPGMTAEVEFIVSSTENVLLVPNSALRYEPTSLTSDEIAAKIFEASLAGLPEAERAAAVEMNAAATGKDAVAETTAKTSGLSSLVMGGGSGAPPGGVPGGAPGGPPGSFSGTDRAKSKSATAAGTAPAAPVQATKNIWYLDDSGNLAVIKVRVGVTDGSNTEVSADTDIEGMKIISKEKAL